MFGIGSGDMGGLGYPAIHRPSSKRRPSKKDATPQTSKHHTYPSAAESFEPAIDGPPSPERIRAYTERMRKGSTAGTQSNTPSFTSATSFRSRQSSLDSFTLQNLQRKSSQKSNSSSMGTKERPESLTLFGKSLFSRSNKKYRQSHSSQGSTSSLSRKSYEGSPPRVAGNHARKNTISGPYNFQHVTHTRQEQIPDLKETPRLELVTEFSAIRASQAPTKGGLKGIRARDLMFENFSSVALDQMPIAPSSPTSPRSPTNRGGLKRPGALRTATAPQPWRSINYSVSHDNLRSPPVRPPRSPESPRHSVAFRPARTSSRTASTFFNHVDPMSTAPLMPPYQDPTPFDFTNHSQAPPSPPKWNSAFDFSDKHMSHAVTTPGDEAWPLSGPLSGPLDGNFGENLADVPEEEESSERSRSSSSVELRMSRSVPGLRTKALEQAPALPDMGAYFARAGANETSSPYRISLSSIPPRHDLFCDSWEDDIDYCYEHEAEADCDYNWDKTSDDENAASTSIPTTTVESAADEQIEKQPNFSPGRFRPSLLVPARFDIPDLSPLSGVSSASSYLHTPTDLDQRRPSTSSHTPSFKEADRFNLSPTLLIPGDDYTLQNEQDALFNTYHHNQVSSGTIFPMDTYDHPSSPIDETLSSTVSYRSSVYSHGSLRSSTSTRYNRSSQDSALLIYQAGSISQAHRSISSASSLPDLVPSLRPKRDSRTLAVTMSDPELKKTEDDLPAIDITSRPRPDSCVFATNPRNKPSKSNYFAPPLTTASTATVPESSILSPVVENLSPVAESFTDSPPRVELRPKASASVLQTPVSASVDAVISSQHSRKVSAPIDSIVSGSSSELKRSVRTRSNTLNGKRRGSYMLFPHPPTN